MRIQARGLVVRKAGRAVVDGVDLGLGDGELVGLIGPNGAGKTSLARALAMLEPPAAGDVLYDGSPAEAMPARERARRVAFLAQNAPVHWALRAEQVVALGRLPHRETSARAEDAEAIARAMHAAGVHHLAGRGVDSLSGGERARVLIARALAVEAPVLIADEPIAALDPYHQLAIMDLLRGTAAAGRSVLVVLHDLALAARFCDRLVLMAAGRVLADGRPADVLTDAALARSFGISVMRGGGADTAFVLPWQRLPQEGQGS